MSDFLDIFTSINRNTEEIQAEMLRYELLLMETQKMLDKPVYNLIEHSLVEEGFIDSFFIVKKPFGKYKEGDMYQR